MPRKEKKYHFIYKTTNMLNGKYYYGMHSTNDLEDGYLGSGKRLRYSINKYGKNNHSREILEFLNDRKELKEREREIVNLDEIAKFECMNISIGGLGGIQNDKHLKNWKIGNSKGGKKNHRIAYNQHLYNLNNDSEYRRKYSDTMKEVNSRENTGFSNRTHDAGTKIRIGKSNSISQLGSKNSQFGTCWIYNSTLNESKKIKKENLDLYKNKGWIKGRKLK